MFNINMTNKLNPVVFQNPWKPPNVIESNAPFEKDSVRMRKTKCLIKLEGTLGFLFQYADAFPLLIVINFIFFKISL
jgi:hypothetical protein